MLQADAHERATTVALRGFGPEILGFLVGMTRNESDALESFSLFCEQLWKGLPSFRWECALRTWCYTLARHAVSRNVRGRRPVEPLSSTAVAALVDTISTATLPFIRAQQQERVAALRAELDPDERALLALRIDKDLDWRDIARVMHADDDPAPAELDRTSAALRKRFERVKSKLRALAEQRGLS